MNVLSICDGISCGQVALQRAEIKVDKYFASEIDEKAIAITQKNFPDTIQLGDLKQINGEILSTLPKIDLLIGGTPCQNLSILVINDINHNQGLKGEKSSLFYNFYEIYLWLKKYNNPNIKFLLENVESMNDEDKEIISDCLDIQALEINSANFSAQERKRYYWTNIEVNMDKLPKNGTCLLSIMEFEVDEKYYYSQDYDYYGLGKRVCATLHINGHDILKRVYNPYFKCATLTAVCGGNQQKKVLDMDRVRKLTPKEYERLQTLPDGYTDGFADTVRYKAIGNGWTVSVVSWIFEFMKKEVSNEEMQ